MPPTKRNSTSEASTLPVRRSSRARIQRQVMTIGNLGSGSFSAETRINEAIDPLELKGRDIWNQSMVTKGIDGIKNPFLTKFSHKEGDWGFYPSRHGDVKEVKILGIRGVHYAAGYMELGKMVVTYGGDVSKWLSLPQENAPADEGDDESTVNMHIDISSDASLTATDEQEPDFGPVRNNDTQHLVIASIDSYDQRIPRTSTGIETTTSPATSSFTAQRRDLSAATISPNSTSNSGTRMQTVSASGALDRIARLEDLLDLEQKNNLSRLERLNLCEVATFGYTQNGALLVRIANLELNM